MIRTLTASLLVVATVVLPLVACSTPPSEAPPAAAQPAPSPAKTAARSISACSLVTTDEVQAAAGWAVKQAIPTENPGPPALSICNFMGADLTRVITVWYGEGSGGRYKTSAEMATALGTRDGMLTKPAQAIDGLGVPATREDHVGGLIHVHGINGAGNELTVAAGSFDAARELFIKALPKIPTS